MWTLDVEEFCFVKENLENGNQAMDVLWFFYNSFLQNFHNSLKNIKFTI